MYSATVLFPTPAGPVTSQMWCVFFALPSRGDAAPLADALETPCIVGWVAWWGRCVMSIGAVFPAMGTGLSYESMVDKRSGRLRFGGFK